MVNILFITSLIAFSLADSDGSWFLSGSKGYAGEITLNNLTGSSLFYTLFEKKDGDISSDKAPLILWIDGGPGCSGATAMYTENIGPFYIDDERVPQFNNYTWTTHFHVMYVDYPLGVGYSYVGSPGDYRNTSIGAAEYFYTFLSKLVQKYPSWFERDFYIFGHSYAGHFATAIVYTIITNNLAGNGYIPIVGFGLGDPWVHPPVQAKAFSEVSYDVGILDSNQKNIIDARESAVISLINSQQYREAGEEITQIHNLLSGITGGIDITDIRNYGTSPYMGQMPAWMNLVSTKDTFNMRDDIYWANCNYDVNAAFAEDSAQSTVHLLPLILEHIKLIIYSGQDDLIVSNSGTVKMLEYIEWEHIQPFLNSRRSVWKVNGQVAGYSQFYDNFRFVQLLKAGHFAAYSQPEFTRDMVYRFINDLPFY